MRFVTYPARSGGDARGGAPRVRWLEHLYEIHRESAFQALFFAILPTWWRWATGSLAIVPGPLWDSQKVRIPGLHMPTAGADVAVLHHFTHLVYVYLCG